MVGADRVRRLSFSLASLLHCNLGAKEEPSLMICSSRRRHRQDDFARGTLLTSATSFLLSLPLIIMATSRFDHRSACLACCPLPARRPVPVRPNFGTAIIRLARRRTGCGEGKGGGASLLSGQLAADSPEIVTEWVAVCRCRGRGRRRTDAHN